MLIPPREVKSSFELPEPAPWRTTFAGMVKDVTRYVPPARVTVPPPAAATAESAVVIWVRSLVPEQTYVAWDFAVDELSLAATETDRAAAPETSARAIIEATTMR
jgi:hypothetical protein